MTKKKVILFTFCILFFLGVQPARSEPTNIIVFIGDGMGFEQVKAAGMYGYGAEGTLLFETFPYQAEVTTYSASSSVTDSGAAATAIATGFKVNNGVISTEIPGDNGELYTLLEYSIDAGKSTGLVTTAFMTNATPAAFGAHEDSRGNFYEIAQDYLNQTRPNVLFGGGNYGISVADAEAAGYTVVLDRAEMQGLNTATETLVSGQFGNYHLPYEYQYFTGFDDGYDTLPHLSEMTSTALDILKNDPDGFFLMVEGARIDHGGHANMIDWNTFETLEFENALNVVMNWAQGRSDTLILVTADHETGGLTVLQNNGQGVFPDVSWSTSSHTGTNVPIYAWGQNADRVTGILDNTELFDIATCLNSPVRIVGNPSGYASIQLSYDLAQPGDTIYSRALLMNEDLNFNRNISVSLVGGFDCTYEAFMGKTVLNGNMTISNGTLTIASGTFEVNQY
jgi:alkaline phosphatase